jgi:NADH:ubiquinone reductase (non-electrogenic)
MMVKNGVQIATSSVIEKVDDEYLHVKGQDPVPYGILLWVTGNKSLSFVDGLDVKKSEHGLSRILTDGNLRVKKAGVGEEILDDVFALGDTADIEGQSLPTTAEVAYRRRVISSIY